MNSNSVHARWLVAMSVALGSAGVGAAALNSDACKGLNAPRGAFIYLVDKDLKKVDGTSLDLGIVDFSATRVIEGRYFVVSSPNIETQSRAGGSEFQSSIGDPVLRCQKLKVSPLLIGFDSSPLPPGRFEEPMPLYVDDPARPPLTASVGKVTGSVRRVWLETEISAKDSSVARQTVRLTNRGNAASGKIALDIVNPSSVFSVVDNRCDGKVLQLGDFCEFSVDVSPGRATDARYEYEIPIDPDGLPYAQSIWLGLSKKDLIVSMTNK